jgi:hypothetical protein
MQMKKTKRAPRDVITTARRPSSTPALSQRHALEVPRQGENRDVPALVDQDLWRHRAAALFEEMRQALGDLAARMIWKRVSRMTGRTRGRPKGARTRIRYWSGGPKPTDVDYLRVFDEFRARDASLSDWSAALAAAKKLGIDETALPASIARRIIRHHKERQRDGGGLDK